MAKDVQHCTDCIPAALVGAPWLVARFPAVQPGLTLSHSPFVQIELGALPISHRHKWPSSGTERLISPLDVLSAVCPPVTGTSARSRTPVTGSGQRESSNRASTSERQCEERTVAGIHRIEGVAVLILQDSWILGRDKVRE